MIQLTPTLLGFDVPLEANTFTIEYYDNHKDKYIHFIGSYFRGLPNYDYIDLPKGNNYELLGTYSPDGIDFDCRNYVLFTVVRYHNMNEGEGEDIMFHNYNNPNHFAFTEQDSFRSLLTSKGCDLSKKYVIVTIKK